MSDFPETHLHKSQKHADHIKQDHSFKFQRITFSNHHISNHNIDPTMSSPATLITIASDVVVLGAAVSVAGVGIKSLATKYSKGASSAIKSTLGGTQSSTNDDENVI